jgi:putative nucleotidyltransferase with HDIG domain
LITGVDRALYRAKDSGRNCICNYDPELDRAKVVTPHQMNRAREEMNDRTTEILATAVGVKDDYTQGHSTRVTEYAMQLGIKMNLSSEDRRSLRTAGLLHDVGKTGIPDEILKKPGALTQREQEIVRTHPSVGGYIVRQTIKSEDIISAIVYHHERWDGGGYPEGLTGERIPLLARILAVADTFDALTSDRPYREALPIDAAAEEIARNSATQFDPRIVSAFMDCIRRNRAFSTLPMRNGE